MRPPEGSRLPLRVTKAEIAVPLSSCWRPTTAASATAGWSTKALSTSIVLILCPATFMTSSTRPRSQRYPSSSRFAPSPVKYTPGKRDQYCWPYRSGSP